MSDFIELSDDVLVFSESLFCELNIDIEDDECDIGYFFLDQDLNRIISKDEDQQEDEDDLLQILQVLLRRTDSLAEKVKIPMNKRREKLMSFEKTVL